MESDIYCLKCRSYTPNEDFRIGFITTKAKERKVQKANCSVCGKKKNRFVRFTDQNNPTDSHIDLISK